MEINMSMTLDEIIKNFSGESNLNVGIDTAIKSLRPGAKWDISANGSKYTFTRYEDPQNRPVPTDDEINNEYQFQLKAANYYKYTYDRCANYPDGFEQLDMLWHAIDQGKDLKDSEWFKTIKEVKEKYPKPIGNPPTKE